MTSQRDRTKRIAGLTFTLVLASVLLPGVIIEDGGWRAWLGTLAVIGLLVTLIDEIRTARRQRKAAKQQQPE